MLLAAAAELGLDLSRSWLIGDKPRDIDAALAAGIMPERALLVDEQYTIADAADAVLVRSGLAAPRGASAGNAQPADPSGTASDRDTPRGPAATGASFVPATTVRLACRTGALADARVRGTVESAARDIAERTGVGLVALSVTAARCEATLATHRLGALGFAADLRRRTDAWHAARGGGPLWG